MENITDTQQEPERLPVFDECTAVTDSHNILGMNP
jgi:hypothetical protein